LAKITLPISEEQAEETALYIAAVGSRVYNQVAAGSEANVNPEEKTFHFRQDQRALCVFLIEAGGAGAEHKKIVL
jgi:hypothetical protein